MQAMPVRTLVIVNPASRNGSTGRRFGPIEAKLRDVLGPLEVEWTRAPRDAERITREGVRAGVERLVVAGGDGTMSEVASGLLGGGLARYAAVGLLPLGTGFDLARSLGVPRQLDSAIEALARGKARVIDAGLARFRGRDGEDRASYFVNVGSFGVSGLTTELVNRAPKLFGARASYFLGAVRAIARWRAVPIELRVDGTRVHEGPVDLVAAANACYFGGGMRVAPHAQPDDGLLDVIVVAARSRRELLRRLPSLYRGDHLRVASVSEHRGRRIEMHLTSPSAGGGPAWIELDGEPLGTLPLRCEIVPNAVTLFGVE